MTVNKAVLNITERDFAPGLSYVAVSRVKTLDGVLFEKAFDYSRFRTKPTETINIRIVNARNRER